MSEMRSGQLNTHIQTPTIVVIFGATGDLSQKKLIPALFHLFCGGHLPSKLKIVGMARRDLGDEGFHAFVREALMHHASGREAERDAFLQHFTYHAGDFSKPGSYHVLSEQLIGIEDTFGQCTNKLFYLAVPPVSYEQIFRELADSGLTIPCSDETGWTRVLVEKPFGNDTKTATHLDTLLGLLFREEQIFRIDHYLAKEALQDILLFRFSNTLFEPAWNREHIERVEIKLFESKGIDGRGALYDGLGALRDVGQNHLLQMLALIAMENPSTLVDDAVRAARAKVLSHVDPIRLDDAVRGQYDGYRDAENGVAADSQTETYFKITAHINNDRWRGVPFVLESGKALVETKTEIIVYFNPPKGCLCGGEVHEHGNVLTFRIQPDEGIKILFWAKQPGFARGLEQKMLSFSYRDLDAKNGRIPDAYERVLFDAFTGDQLLFTSTDEVAAAWNIITPLLTAWQNTPLHSYEKGSTGPK